MIMRMFKEIYAYRELMFALAYRDIRVKYKQALMGIAWVFLMPLLAIMSGICFRIAMSVFAGRSLALETITGLMVKTVPWLLFSGVVGTASASLLGNMGLISKIYFPRKIVPVSSILSTLVDFTIACTGVIIILTTIGFLSPTIYEVTGWAIFGGGSSGVTLSWMLLMVPLLIALLVLMGLGLGLLFGAANLFFRDVKYIVQVLLQYGVFFSLVFFTYTELGQYGWVLLLNPVAPILESMRCIVVQGQMDPYLWPWLVYSVIMTLLIAMVGCTVFDRAESLFAEYA